VRAPPTLKQVVATHLRQAIYAGQLRATEKIDQDQIAADLGVSKLPVREALISLESEGLIVNVARRGCFVAPLTREDISDHYLLMGKVSGLASRRAATKMTEDDIATLRSVLDQLNTATDAKTQDQLNHQFHRHINLIGASRRLLSALQIMRNTMPSNFFEYAKGWSETAYAEHEQILRSLAARDPDDAEAAMVHHMASGADFAVSVMESAGFWNAADAAMDEAAAAIDRRR
jgi:DNA-binding GntR family transcriptional regulator